MERTILVQKSDRGSVKYKTIEVDGKEVRRFWGWIGGEEKEQATSHVYSGMNVGKVNEISGEENAINNYRRIIDKNVRDGYAVVGEGMEMMEVAEKFSRKEEEGKIELEVDSSLCISKPVSSVDIGKLEVLRKIGRLLYEVKYNGMCHYIVVDNDYNVNVYTRKWHDHSRKYMDIIESFKEIEMFGKRNTMVVGEMVWEDFESGHVEKFKRMSEISKVDCVGGIVKEDVSETESRKEGKIKFVVFGVLYLDGKDVTKTHNIREMREEWIDKLDNYVDGVIVKPQKFCTKNGGAVSYGRALEFLKEKRERYEGLVAWDLEDYMVISAGTPKRRAGWKVKVSVEEDVIAYGYLEGKGDKQGRIGSLLIGKLGEDGEMVSLGRVGSGLRDDECTIDDWVFPVVIAIEYNEVFESGAYQFPRFIKRHEDKEVSEIRI